MSSSTKMDNVNLIKCKGCPGKFQINVIRRHIANRPSCHEKYTALECKALENQYQDFRKANRAAQYREKTLQNPAKVCFNNSYLHQTKYTSKIKFSG